MFNSGKSEYTTRLVNICFSVRSVQGWVVIHSYRNLGPKMSNIAKFQFLLFFFQAKWTDKRLSDFFSPGDPDSYYSYVVGPEILSDIWTPSIQYETIISNQFTLDGGEVSVELPKGQIEYRRSGTFTFSCKIDLHYFPFDEHTCEVSVDNIQY